MDDLNGETNISAGLDALRTIAGIGGSPGRRVFLDAQFFAPPKQLCERNPALPALKAERAGLDRELAALHAELSQVEKTLVQKDARSRDSRIRDVVAQLKDAYEGDITGKYTPMRTIELEFAQLLLDEREREGRTLRQWFDTLESREPGDFPAADVSAYVDEFVERFRTEFAVPPTDALFLRVLMQRVIFPRIHRAVSTSGQQDVALNARFHAQVKWLRTLSQAALGIEAEYRLPVDPANEVEAHVHMPSFTLAESVRGGDSFSSIISHDGEGSTRSAAPSVAPIELASYRRSVQPYARPIEILEDLLQLVVRCRVPLVCQAAL
jgi:hypothetical protein